MSTGTTIADQVIALCEFMSAREANPDSRLHEDLDLDSLDRIQLAMKVEEHFGIDIPDADVDDPSLGTVAGLIRYVEGRVQIRFAQSAGQLAEVFDRPGAEL